MPRAVKNLDNKKADCTRQSNQSASETTNSQPIGNESMNSLALSFNDVTFNPVSQNDGQIWLTSSQIAEALEYKNTQSITKLFNTNSDEFDETMVKIVKLPTVNHAVTDSVTTLKTKGLSNKIRIFSLRGCHLLAMFARTEKAKEFRKWVLNILAKEVGQPVIINIADEEKISDTQAYKLKTAVEKRCKNNKEHYQTVWTALKHRFEVPKYTDILVKDFDNAMNLVWTIALPPVVEKPQPQMQTDKELYEILHAAISSHHQLHRMTKSLAVTLHVRDTIDYQLRGLREDIIRAVKFANNQNLYNKLGLPLVSHDARLNAWDGASWSIAATA